jgi:hypothetical protein
MRKMLGAGKPRELANRMAELVSGAMECLINFFTYKSAAISTLAPQILLWIQVTSSPFDGT